MLLFGHAVTNCLDMKEIFDRDTATNVLGRLVEEQELPKLIVRTLINVWHAHTEMQRCARGPLLDPTPQSAPLASGYSPVEWDAAIGLCEAFNGGNANACAVHVAAFPSCLP